MRVGDICWIIEDETGASFGEPLLVTIEEITEGKYQVYGESGYDVMPMDECFETPNKAINYALNKCEKKLSDAQDKLSEVEEEIKEAERELEELNKVVDNHKRENDPTILTTLLKIRDKEVWSQHDYEQANRVFEQVESEFYPLTEEYLEGKGCPTLVDDIAAFLTDYEKIANIIDVEVKQTLDKQVKEDYIKLLSIGTRLVTIFHEEAAQRYKGKAWQTKYLTKRFAESEEWATFVELAQKNPKLNNGQYNNDFRRKLEEEIRYETYRQKQRA